MSTASKREELEAAAWMVPGISTSDVDRILNRADRYASAFGADLLDQLARDRDPDHVARGRRTADRRDRLEEALEDTR